MPADLRLFRYALAVADAGGFSHAAQRLGIAQPPLSQQIRRLEQALGITLFVRSRTGAVPTPEGLVFLERARAALATAERAIEAARAAGRGEAGRLVLGIAGAAMFSFLPPLLRDFRAAFPAIALDLRNVEPHLQLPLIAGGTLDAGFTRAAPVPPGVTLELAHAEPFVAALAAGSRLARRAQLGLADLAAEPFVMFPHHTDGGFHAEVAGLCLAAGFAPRIAQEIAPMHAVIGLVGAGLGVAVVPASVRALRLQHVVYRGLRGLRGMSRIYLARRTDGAGLVAERFVRFVRARLPRGQLMRASKEVAPAP